MNVFTRIYCFLDKGGQVNLVLAGVGPDQQSLALALEEILPSEVGETVELLTSNPDLFEGQAKAQALAFQRFVKRSEEWRIKSQGADNANNNL